MYYASFAFSTLFLNNVKYDTAVLKICEEKNLSVLFMKEISQSI